MRNLSIAILFCFILLCSGTAEALTLPSGIVAYAPITFTNNQGTALTANTPLSFTFNALAYQQYETNTLNNTELFYQNGTVAVSWLEGNVQNEQQQANTLYISNTVLYWFRTPLSYSWIGANTGVPLTNTIYLGFAGNTPNAGNLLWSSAVGVAPQITCASPSNTIIGCIPGNGVVGIYGEYDNGANVFSLYDNFSGTSIKSSIWSNLGTVSYVVNNGIFVPNQGINSINTYNPQSNTLDFLGTIPSSTCSSGAPTSLFIGWNALNLGIYAYGYYLGCNFGLSYINWKGGTSSYPSIGTVGVVSPYEITANSLGSLFYYQYRLQKQLTNEFLQTTAATVGTYGSAYLQWMNVRLSPSNNIMPPATFGQTQTLLTTPTLTLSNTMIDQGQVILLTASTQGTGAQPFSYAYNVYATNTQLSSVVLLANALYTGNSVTSNTWVLSTAALGSLYVGNTLFKANVVVTDSTGTTLNSISTSFGWNAMPTIISGTNTVSNTLMDSGQYVTFGIGETGGTGKGSTLSFNAELYNITNIAQQGSNVIISALGGTNALTIKTGTTGTFTYNWIIADAGTGPGGQYVFNSISNSITVNAALGTPTLSASLTPSVTTGQTEVFTASFSGGTAPYTYNFLIFNSVTNVLQTNSLIITNSFTTNTYTWVVPASASAGVGNTITGNVEITDSATTNQIKFSANFAAVTVSSSYTAPPTPSLTLSNVLIDQGQSDLLTATVTGGTTPYTYNFQIVNSITLNTISNMLLTSDSNLVQTWVFTPTTAMLGNTIYANVVVTDAHPTTVNSVYNAIGYNAILTLPVISPTSATYTNPPATQTWTANGFTGGTPPYTYNWFVLNPFGELLSSASYTGNMYTSNTFTYTFTVTGSNPYTINVVVTDSASTPVIFNSVNSLILVQGGTSAGGGGGGGSPSITNISQTTNAIVQTVQQTVTTLQAPGQFQLAVNSFILSTFFYKLNYSLGIQGSTSLYAGYILIVIFAAGFAISINKRAKGARKLFTVLLVLSIMAVGYGYLFLTLP